MRHWTETTATGSSSLRALGVVFATWLLAGTASAAFTTPECLAEKRKAWTALRKCEGAEDAKRIVGKLFDTAKCQTAFETSLAKTDSKAARAGTPCRYGDNGDGTITDYATGLQWEQKTGGVAAGGFVGFCLAGDPHCVNDIYNWSDAHAFVSGTTLTGSTVVSPFVGPGWRLPTVVELRSIFDELVPGCGPTLACIDPIFGPTIAGNYWSSSTNEPGPTFAYIVPFQGGLGIGNKAIGKFSVRAVRSQL